MASLLDYAHPLSSSAAECASQTLSRLLSLFSGAASVLTAQKSAAGSCGTDNSDNSEAFLSKHDWQLLLAPCLYGMATIASQSNRVSSVQVSLHTDNLP